MHTHTHIFNYFITDIIFNTQFSQVNKYSKFQSRHQQQTTNVKRKTAPGDILPLCGFIYTDDDGHELHNATSILPASLPWNVAEKNMLNSTHTFIFHPEANSYVCIELRKQARLTLCNNSLSPRQNVSIEEKCFYNHARGGGEWWWWWWSGCWIQLNFISSPRVGFHCEQRGVCRRLQKRFLHPLISKPP